MFFLLFFFLQTDKDVEFNIEILSGPSARLNITYIEGTAYTTHDISHTKTYPGFVIGEGS